jgi:hypothetical protein
MDKLRKLLQEFSKQYPLLKDIVIEITQYNHLYIAMCLVDKVGDFIPVKKGRIRNVVPTKIILSDVAIQKKEDDLLFLFIHECTHGITPQRERKVKNGYIRIDHSRHFYENFLQLLSIAYHSNYISYNYTNIDEIMKRDNRMENVKNDMKLYGDSAKV